MNSYYEKHSPRAQRSPSLVIPHANTPLGPVGPIPVGPVPVGLVGVGQVSVGLVPVTEFVIRVRFSSVFH